MLGKLIKNEWRAFWKIPAFINIFLAVYTLFGVLSLLTEIVESDNPVVNALIGVMFLLYVIAIFAISFVISLYVAMRFYKNMYTDEGYLMHTLPVTKKELIFSKLIVAFIWTVITGIVMTASVLALIFALFSAAQTEVTLAEIWQEISSVFFSPEFSQVMGMSFPVFAVIFLITVIIGIFSNILMVYTSISFGQLFQKHKVIGAIVSYICIYTILQIANSIATAPVMFSTAVSDILPDSIIAPALYFGLGESVVLCIVYFLLTEWLMKKKLNLD